MLYGNGVPDVVGRFSVKPFNDWNGMVMREVTSARVRPGRRSSMRSTRRGLKPYCTLQAVTDAKNGQILLQNRSQDVVGTWDKRQWSCPALGLSTRRLSKSIKVTESKSFQFRIDATNVFNHPLMGNPNLSLNATTPFGSIQAKGTQRRQFKAQLRLNF
jgi:hypothetical protein